MIPRPCKIREKVPMEALSFASEEVVYDLRCAFTRSTCCEVMGIYCPIWKIVNEGTYEP